MCCFGGQLDYMKLVMTTINYLCSSQHHRNSSMPCFLAYTWMALPLAANPVRIFIKMHLIATCKLKFLVGLNDTIDKMNGVYVT